MIMEVKSQIKKVMRNIYDPHLFEYTMQSRVKHVIPGKVSKPMKEVLVPVSDPLCESIGRHLSENCCDLGCLSAFNNDEIY